MRRCALVAALFLGLSSFGHLARATIVLDLDLGQLAQRAHHVVRATVIDQATQWDAQHKPVTLTRLRVSRRFKGEAAAELVVRQPGGVVDGLEMRVAGAARFSSGEDVVVFLEESADGRVVPLTMGGGKFAVVRTADGLALERSVEGLTFARQRADGLVAPSDRAPAIPARITFEQLEKATRAGANR